MSNSLSAVHPELVAEWSDKNFPLTPDSVTFGSNKKVWWKGACGHEWETSVKARSNGEKCPTCSDSIVLFITYYRYVTCFQYGKSGSIFILIWYYQAFLYFQQILPVNITLGTFSIFFFASI